MASAETVPTDNANILLRPGDTIGPYRVVRTFPGHGGMAQIYEVEVQRQYRRRDIPRRLAMKVARPEYEAALSAEAEFLRRFSHPHVVRIYPLIGYHKPIFAAREQFPFGWGWYYTMELVDGGSLAQYLFRTTLPLRPLRDPAQKARPLSLRMALGIARQIASALEHIHGQHVLNLDVKPGNILFRRRRFKFLRDTVPQAVLCDFGLARDKRYPRSGILGVATPEYTSPEQVLEAEGLPIIVDDRADIFSLGVLLYEMLTGELPFAEVAQIKDPDFVPVPVRQHRPGVPEKLEAVVMRALAKTPEDRFQSMSEMRRALEEIPMPPDREVMLRRGAAGLVLAAWLATSGWALREWMNYTETLSSYTPVPIFVPTLPPAPVAGSTLTPRPRATPSARPTSTPAPTPVRPTVTPIPGG